MKQIIKSVLSDKWCNLSCKHTFLSLGLFLVAIKATAQANFPVYSDTTGLGISAHKIIMNTDGSFVTLGTINEYSPFSFLSGKGFTICKYSNSGVIIWQKNFEYNITGYYFYASDMIRAADSGYVVLADSAINSGMSIAPNFIILIKFDESGNRQWSSYFDDSSSSWGFGHDHRIKSIPGTNEYVVSNYYNMYKFDVHGNRIHTNTNPGALHNFAFDTGGRVAVTTSGSSPSLVFADSNFNFVSSHPLSPNTSYYDVTKTADGHWLTLGRRVLANNLYLIYLNKLNANGSQVWERTFNYNVIPEGMSIFEKDSNYYFTASDKICLNSDTPSSCHGVSNAVIVKTDTSGNELAHIFETGSLLAGYQVISNFGNQSVFYGDTIFTIGTFSRIGEYGYLSESPVTTAYVIWKYSFTAFGQLGALSPVLKQDIMVYPTPANDRLNVNCPRCVGQNVTIIIYNWMGQQVYIGTYLSKAITTISTVRMSPGLYTLEIMGNQIHEKQKITVMH